MNKFSNNKRGMLLLVVIGLFAVAFIFFIAVIDRVRYEGQITHRGEIGERLYQVASAVGQLAIRRVEKLFEMRLDEQGDFGKEIFEAVEAGKTGYIELEEDDSDLTEKLSGEPYKSIKNLFKEQWKSKGELNMDAHYKIELFSGNKRKFSDPLAGCGRNKRYREHNLEVKGRIHVFINVSQFGVAKKLELIKDFYIVKLLPEPFYRFTLLSQKGATLDAKKANRLEVKFKGELFGEQKPPLVCINRYYTDKSRAGDAFNCNELDKFKYSSDGGNGQPLDFAKNGWIYLGGDSEMVNIDGKHRLMLNICHGGNGDDNLDKEFGELFHLYYSDSSLGWLEYDNFQNLSYNGNAMSFSFVCCDTGFFNNVLELDCHPRPVNDHRTRFKGSLEGYFDAIKSKCPNYSKSERFPTLDYFFRGSALHLYGTSSQCTPTLVFGPVCRRVIRSTGINILYKNYSTIWGIPGIQQETLGNMIFEPRPENPELGIRPLFEWLTREAKVSQNPPFNNLMFDNEASKDYDLFAKSFVPQVKSNQVLARQLIPQVLEDSYNESLINICYPVTGPTKSWRSSVGSMNTVKRYLSDNSNKIIGKDSYNFEFKSDDPNINYSGSLEGLDLSNNYLRDRVSYVIESDANGNEIKLSENNFFKSNFLGEISDKAKNSLSYCKNPKNLFLGQIIEFKCDKLVIDVDLICAMGGIIICDGDIIINANIINPYLDPSLKSKYEVASEFGWLTLISRNGDIKFNHGDVGKKPNAIADECHGIFITKSSKSVIPDKRMHFIGSVTTGNIEALVDNGCIVQWGFDPDELSSGKDLSHRDYYGLVSGPRDTEIILEGKL